MGARKGRGVVIPWLPPAVLREIVKRTTGAERFGAKLSGLQCQWVRKVAELALSLPKEGAPRRYADEPALFQGLAASGKFRTKEDIYAAMAEMYRQQRKKPIPGTWVVVKRYDQIPAIRQRMKRACAGHWPEIVRRQKEHK